MLGVKRKFLRNLLCILLFALAKRQSCNLCALGRYNTLYIIVHMICILYMYNMYTYVIIIWHLFQRKFSRSWMTYLLTSSFVLLELHSCNDLKWRVTWQTEYWAKGAWMKAKSIEEEKPESDWNLKRTEGARKKTGEQVTVVGKLEWNLVLCGSLSVDLSFLRGLVLHGSKSVSCSHFQHTVEIVDLPYITFFPRLGHARILAGATERTLWFQHSSPSWAVPFNGNLVRELSVCEWTVTVVYAKIDERHRTSLKYRNVQSPGHVWSVGQLFQKGFKSSCDNLRQALRELQSMCYTLRCPQSALGIMMYNGHTALKVSRELPDRRVRLKFFFQEYTDQLGCTRPVRAVRKLSAKPCSFVGKNWSEQHFFTCFNLQGLPSLLLSGTGNQPLSHHHLLSKTHYWRRVLHAGFELCSKLQARSKQYIPNRQCHIVHGLDIDN